MKIKLNKLKNDSQEIINNLQETVDSLIKIAFEYQTENEALNEKINRQKAEIEELRNIVKTDLLTAKEDFKLSISDITKIRAEAIKEFAEKLHDIFVSKVKKYYCKIKEEYSFKFLESYLVDDVLSNIDYVKKEMVGDDNA